MDLPFQIDAAATPAPRSPTAELGVIACTGLVVEVFWTKEKKWFTGKLFNDKTSKKMPSGSFGIKYDDDDRRYHNFTNPASIAFVKWKVAKKKRGRPETKTPSAKKPKKPKVSPKVRPLLLFIPPPSHNHTHLLQ